MVLYTLNTGRYLMFSNHYSAVKELSWEDKLGEKKHTSYTLVMFSPRYDVRVPYNQPSFGLHKGKIEHVFIAFFNLQI